MTSAHQPTLSTSTRPTRVRWLVLGLSFATSWLLYLHRYSWGVIKSDVRSEFDLSYEQVGYVDSAFNLSYAILQIPAGLAGDWFGPALVLPLIIFAWSGVVAAMVIGRGFWSFVGLRLLFGATQAGTYPNLCKVTRNWFPLSSRTTMQGLIASFGGRAGGAFAPLIVGTLLLGWLDLSWRQSLLVVAVLGVFLALLFSLLFRNSPREHPWVNEAEAELIETGETPVSTETRFTFSRRPAAQLSFGFLLLGIFTSAFADQLFVYWIPSYLLDEKQLSREAMGIFASLPLFGGALGGLFGGVLNDWIYRISGRRQLARCTVGFLGKLMSAVLIALSLSLADGRQMMMVVAAGKFFTDWSQPTTWGAVTDISGPAAGRVFGAVNMCGSLGAVLAGPILGRIVDGSGWTTLFWTIVCVYIVSSLCWLFIDTSKPLVIVQAKEGSP